MKMACRLAAALQLRKRPADKRRPYIRLHLYGCDRGVDGRTAAWFSARWSMLELRGEFIDSETGHRQAAAIAMHSRDQMNERLTSLSRVRVQYWLARGV